MSDLRIDFGRLIRARDRLESVIGEFEGAGEIHAHLPSATGHPRVQGAVEEFRDAWRVRRDQMSDELTFLKDAVSAIHDTFRELDGELVDRLGAFTEASRQENS